jgi:hypothetical protein
VTARSGGAYDEHGTLIPPGFRGTPVPAAFRPVELPAGSTVRVRSRPGGPPPSLTVEDARGENLLTLTVTPDGRIDAQYDPERITEAARRFLLEIRELLGHQAADPSIRIATGVPPRQ